MITLIDYENTTFKDVKEIKVTAKQWASWMISAQIQGYLECLDLDETSMTKREQELVWKQLYKYQTRIDKLLGLEGE